MYLHIQCKYPSKLFSDKKRNEELCMSKNYCLKQEEKKKKKNNGKILSTRNNKTAKWKLNFDRTNKKTKTKTTTEPKI